MNFTLSPEQRMLQKVVREFAENEVEPIAAEIDQTHRFPRETFEKMAEVGFTGINIPKEFGGAGADELSKSIVVTELAKKCASTAVIFSVHTLFNYIITTFGNEDQKNKYLKKIASSPAMGGFALTEPNAGSDAGGVKTTAVVVGDNYIINGAKCFITNGSSDFFVVICSTAPEKGVKGLSAIVVEKGTPGMSIGKVEDKMGISGSETVELIFDNCIVPRENLLSKEGDGFKVAMVGLDSGRISIASQALGIAEGALAEAVKYLKERVQFGKPLAKQQGLQWYIAEMSTRVEAARGLIYHAADVKQKGEPVSKIAAMAKLFASETAEYVTSQALQIHGGYGYMKDYPLERMYRDARITKIYEGTSEVQKIVIAREVLK
jgi:alkylation response protein AidB-like acyl-CoA dehydrogenase